MVCSLGALHLQLYIQTWPLGRQAFIWGTCAYSPHSHPSWRCQESILIPGGFLWLQCQGCTFKWKSGHYSSYREPWQTQRFDTTGPACGTRAPGAPRGTIKYIEYVLRAQKNSRITNCAMSIHRCSGSLTSRHDHDTLTNRLSHSLKVPLKRGGGAALRLCTVQPNKFWGIWNHCVFPQGAPLDMR